jgi:hypothetical protein
MLGVMASMVFVAVVVTACYRNDDRMSVAALDEVALMGVGEYDPLKVVDAVNALQPLGKERALDEVSARADTRDYPYGLVWVLRVLFDVPEETGFPPVRLGTPTIPPPSDPTKLPRFPIVIVRDVPLLAVRGYILRGLPEPIEDQVEFYRAHGSVRSEPLAPPASPADVAGEFARQWRAAYGEEYLEAALSTVADQIARLELTQ